MPAYLEPLTPEAEASLGTQRLLLNHWPFRVGRESRMVVTGSGFKLAERRRSNAAPTNELYLLDGGRRLNVSRAHFQVEKITEVEYRLRDRGSALGTYVGDTLVGGGDTGGEIPLHDGEVIVVGTTESPFVFRFVVTSRS